MQKHSALLALKVSCLQVRNLAVAGGSARWVRAQITLRFLLESSSAVVTVVFRLARLNFLNEVF